MPTTKNPATQKPAKETSADTRVFSLEAVRSLATADAPTPWEQADDPLLVGLERWARAWALEDRVAALRLLARGAQRGFAEIAKRSADELVDVGFFGKEGDQIWDGAALEVQLSRVAAWLDAPDEMKPQIEEAYDRTRQLVAWDDDLRPSDEQSFFWYLEIGQLCCAAVLNRPSLNADDHGDYYGWPPDVCIARGFVVAVRGLRGYESSVEKNLMTLFG